MTQRLPYKVGRTWTGAGWGLFWAHCRVCGVYFRAFDWAKNARWIAKCHVQAEHPGAVRWLPVREPGATDAE